tara:strand:- start:89 stop:1858 length:1770 start_codon:yes stop_codon:yes gene_type:complete
MHRPDHNIQDEILKILDAQRPPTARSESTRTVDFDDGSIEGDISYASEPRVTLGERFLQRQNILSPNTPGFNKAMSLAVDLVPQTPEQGIAELALAPVVNPVVKGVGKGLSYIGRKGAPILKKGLDQGKNLLESMIKSPTADDIAESAFLRSNEEHLTSSAFRDIPAFSDEQVQEAFEQLAGENQMRFQATQRRGPNVQAIRESAGLTSREMEEIASLETARPLEAIGDPRYTPNMFTREQAEVAAEEMVARRQLRNTDLSIRDDAGPVNDPDIQILQEPIGSTFVPAPLKKGTEVIKIQSRSGPTVEGGVRPENLPKINLNVTGGRGHVNTRVLDHSNYRIVEESSVPKIRGDGSKVGHHSFVIGKKHPTDPQNIVSGTDVKHSRLSFETNTKDGITEIQRIVFAGSANNERQTGLMLRQILGRFPGKWRINTANSSFTWDSISLMLKSMMREAEGVLIGPRSKPTQVTRPSSNTMYSKKWEAAHERLRNETNVSGLTAEEYAQKKRYIQQEVSREVADEFLKHFMKNSQGKLPKGPLAPWRVKLLPGSGGTIEYGSFSIQNFKAQLAAFMGIPVSQMPEFLEDLYAE